MSSLAQEHLGIVVVDDDSIFRDLICTTVAKKSKFVMFEASTGDELMSVLAEQRIDCIVMDYNLGADSGLAIKQRVSDSYVRPPPTVMMTGDGREGTAIKAFRMGVSDYLPKKGLCPEYVVASVLRAVEQDRKAALAQAEHQKLVAASAIDPITGLEGRKRLDERIDQLLSMPPTSQDRYALILVEFFGYQEIADRFGLIQADSALRIFGKNLQGLLRSADVCGRYEGGKFLIIADLRSNALDSLESFCGRLAGGLSLRLSFDVADFTICARVAGALFRGDPSGTNPVLSVEAALARTKAGDVVAIVSDLPSLPPAPHGLPASTNSVTAGASSPPALQPSRSSVDVRTIDRRCVARQRVLKRGFIHLLGTNSTINCTIRNISAHGFGLRTEAPCAVPEIFDLEVLGSGARQRVQVRWQIANDLGVKMLSCS